MRRRSWGESCWLCPRAAARKRWQSARARPAPSAAYRVPPASAAHAAASSSAASAMPASPLASLPPAPPGPAARPARRSSESVLGTPPPPPRAAARPRLVRARVQLGAGRRSRGSRAVGAHEARQHRSPCARPPPPPPAPARRGRCGTSAARRRSGRGCTHLPPRARPCTAYSTCPLSTGGKTRRVRLVRGEGRDVST